MDGIVFQDIPLYSIFVLKGTYGQRWMCVFLRMTICLLAPVFVVSTCVPVVQPLYTNPCQTSHGHWITDLQS